jgi:hypothetical protein
VHCLNFYFFVLIKKKYKNAIEVYAGMQWGGDIHTQSSVELIFHFLSSLKIEAGTGYPKPIEFENKGSKPVYMSPCCHL